MQRLGWVLVGAASLVAVAVGLRLTAAGRAACPDFTEVDVSEVDAASGCVTVTGQAHYEVIVKQRVPGNLFTEDREYFLFPVFPQGDTSDRAIKLFVRTERKPESLVTYETMTVSGRLEPVTSAAVPPGTEVSIGQKSDYFFTDAMLMLVPDRIGSDGETWVAPHAR